MKRCAFSSGMAFPHGLLHDSTHASNAFRPHIIIIFCREENVVDGKSLGVDGGGEAHSIFHSVVHGLAIGVGVDGPVGSAGGMAGA